MRARPYRCSLCDLPILERPEWLNRGQLGALERAAGRSDLWEWAEFWDNVSRTGKVPTHHSCLYRWNWSTWTGVPDPERRSPEV